MIVIVIVMGTMHKVHVCACTWTHALPVLGAPTDRFSSALSGRELAAGAAVLTIRRSTCVCMCVYVYVCNCSCSSTPGDRQCVEMCRVRVEMS